MKAVTEGHAMRKHGANGFTLIEMMVVVAIIGILAALAYPSYTRYVAEARRSDATINLTRIAAAQERFFSQCGRYADDLTGANINCPGPAGITANLNANLAAGVTRDGHYTITVAVAPGPVPPGGGVGAAGGGGFTLTAQPAGSQAIQDAAFCNTFTINETGAKSAQGTDSLLGPNGGKCWKK